MENCYPASDQKEVSNSGSLIWKLSSQLLIQWHANLVFFHIHRSFSIVFACSPIIRNIFIKDGKEYKIRSRTEQMVQALKSGLNHPAKDIEAEVAAVYERKTAMKAAMEAKRKPKVEDKFHC